MKSLVVTGSIGIDTVYAPTGQAEDVLGGSAIYFAFGASRLSAVRLVGAAGEDFPEEYLNLLSKNNIDVRGLEIREGCKTFRWTGRYLDDMNSRETVEVHLNVLAESPPIIPQGFRASEYVFLANNDPALQLDFIDQLVSPRFIVADTMDLWINSARKNLERVMSRVDGIILNDGEAKHFTGEGNLILAGKKILEYGPKFVVIKKGEHGAILIERDNLIVIPAYPVENVIDPTGAGDSFAGGFMGYLASVDNTDFKSKAIGLTYATVVASFTIESFSIDALISADREAIENRRSRLLNIMGKDVLY